MHAVREGIKPNRLERRRLFPQVQAVQSLIFDLLLSGNRFRICAQSLRQK